MDTVIIALLTVAFTKPVLTHIQTEMKSYMYLPPEFCILLINFLMAVCHNELF